jgi:tetratricopeptide (TPR) repeat protein
MVMRLIGRFIVLATFALSPTIGAAQPPAGGQAPAPLKNLQVLPKDTPRPQVIQAMQGFAQALGVRCEHCHVDEQGKSDFASDDKRPKNVARAMMRLTDDINSKLPAAVSKTAADATRVQCATCHRGVPIPRQLTDILTQTIGEKGLPAAIEQFREMRKQYYGGQSYDFSEVPLLTIAQRTAQAGKPDDAVTLLQLNLEYYPQSARTYGVLANAYGAKKDTANQIKALEKAVELDPKNEQARQQLERLKKQH